MRRSALALILLAFLAPACYAERLRIPAGVALQTVQSEAVLVGKVTSFEKELTEVKDHPNAKETTAYTIAIVKVESAIRGLKNATHVKVGLLRSILRQFLRLRLLLVPLLGRRLDSDGVKRFPLDVLHI